MEEVLLGRPLLQCLGFDLERHLAQVRTFFENADVSQLMPQVHKQFAGGSHPKIASLPAYQGLEYNRTDDDPIILPEAVGANMGVDTEEEINKAFQGHLSDQVGALWRRWNLCESS